MTTEQTQQILDYVKSAADFASSQVPDIVNQIVLIGRIQYSLLVILSGAILVFGIHLIRKFVKAYNEAGEWGKADEMIKIGISSLVFILVFIFWADSLIRFATVIWAPKLYVLQYIQHLIH